MKRSLPTLRTKQDSFSRAVTPEPPRTLLIVEQAMCQGEELLSNPLDVGVLLLHQPFPHGPFLPEERPPFPVGKKNILVLQERGTRVAHLGAWLGGSTPS